MSIFLGDFLIKIYTQPKKKLKKYFDFTILVSTTAIIYKLIIFFIFCFRLFATCEIVEANGSYMLELLPEPLFYIFLMIIYILTWRCYVMYDKFQINVCHSFCEKKFRKNFWDIRKIFPFFKLITKLSIFKELITFIIKTKLNWYYPRRSFIISFLTFKCNNFLQVRHLTKER